MKQGIPNNVQQASEKMTTNLSKTATALQTVTRLPQAPLVAFVGGVCFALVAGVSFVLFGATSLAGSLTPPGAPANTMYTLTDIYNLASGTTTSEGSGSLPSTPGTQSSTMYSLSQVYTALAGQIANVSSTTLLVGTTAFGETGTVYPAAALETGQTTCWNASGGSISCSGTGQDGELQVGVTFSYTDNGDGTVTDNRTGLTWQQGTTTTYTWTNALAYCNNNTPSLPGSGWRLPQVKELFSLVDFTVTSNAKINLTYFPSTPANNFWSATTYPYSGVQSYAMYVDFGSGGVYADNKALSYYVRCVRE